MHTKSHLGCSFVQLSATTSLPRFPCISLLSTGSGIAAEQIHGIIFSMFAGPLSLLITVLKNNPAGGGIQGRSVTTHVSS